GKKKDQIGPGHPWVLDRGVRTGILAPGREQGRGLWPACPAHCRFRAIFFAIESGWDERGNHETPAWVSLLRVGERGISALCWPHEYRSKRQISASSPGGSAALVQPDSATVQSN